jgi:hypothetical protein
MKVPGGVNTLYSSAYPRHESHPPKERSLILNKIWWNWHEGSPLSLSLLLIDEKHMKFVLLTFSDLDSALTKKQFEK